MKSHTRRKWEIFAISTLCAIPSALEGTAMPIAIPTLVKLFSLSEAEGMWIVNIYLLTMLVCFFITGKLADLFGKRKVFLWGCCILALGSLLGALSKSGWELIASRAIQGLGATLCLPIIAALLMDYCHKNERAKIYGLKGGIRTCMVLAGPAIGGFFVEYFSWRYIFWVSLPFVICSYIVGLFVLPHEKVKKGSFHFSGAIFIMLATSFLIIAIMQGAENGWLSFVSIILFSSSCIFIILFINASKSTPERLIDFSIFKIKGFAANSIIIFLAQAILIFEVFLAIYLQNRFHFSPFEAGKLIVFGSIPYLIVLPLAGYLAEHISQRLLLLVGFVFLMIGLSWYLYFPISKTYFYLLNPLIMISSGIAFVRNPAFVLAIAHVPSQLLVAAITFTKINRYLALTLGLASITAVVQSSKLSSYDHHFAMVICILLLFSFLGFLISLFR